jgi:hypothetical protein
VMLRTVSRRALMKLRQWGEIGARFLKGGMFSCFDLEAPAMQHRSAVHRARMPLE